jgi:hypothetical protein
MLGCHVGLQELLVRIFHGVEDQAIEPEQLRRLHDVLGHSVLRLVQDSGHMVTYAEPRSIEQAIVAMRAPVEL